MLHSGFDNPKGLSRASLTETYNVAEHHNPDCVIIAVELAQQQEFELLASLFRIMRIGCVIVGDPKGDAAQSQLEYTFPRVSDSVTERELCDAVDKAVSQVNRPSIAPTAPAGPNSTDPNKIILIGSSTGGVDALCRILGQFGNQCPPTVIVQHTGGGFANSLIRLLNGATAANVAHSEHGMFLKPGHIYLPPDGQSHITISSNGPPQIELVDGAHTSGHRPSIDRLFASACPHARHINAALLTGMGRDGAQGLRQLRDAGAHTIGQDEASSVVYGMPRIAMEMGAVAEQLHIDHIGPALLRASQLKAKA